MKSGLRIALLLCLVSGTLTQDGFDLSDALFDEEPTPPKPKDTPKVPDVPGKPKDDGLDLLDAFDFGPTPAKPKPPKTPEKPKDDGGFGLDLEDALGPDPNPKPDKPAVKPQPGGGGGSFDDSDLFDVNGGGGYKPDGGPAYDPGYDPNGGADQTQDPSLLWGQILKMLNANMPEEFYMWISNLKRTVAPLLERAMEMLQAMP
ncbi:CD99 molecule isoform X4 [Notolabrus celidotus]|uniref:CD99 molecule isoform X4 n=1 Tax=Notolabrus celidotus TaxID=1203425 RepID=UPI00148FB3E5|nr:CD99 molecule isoform X4 [Notolabrus celidotus]